MAENSLGLNALLHLSDHSVQLFLRACPTEVLTIALSAEGPEVMKRITDNLGNRGGEILREDVDHWTGKSPGAELRAAQAQVAGIFEKLVKDGEIDASELAPSET